MKTAFRAGKMPIFSKVLLKPKAWSVEKIMDFAPNPKPCLHENRVSRRKNAHFFKSPSKPKALELEKEIFISVLNP